MVLYSSFHHNGWMVWAEEWKDFGIFSYILVARLSSLLQLLFLIRIRASSNPQMKYVVAKGNHHYLAQYLPCNKHSFCKYKIFLQGSSSLSDKKNFI